MTARIHRAPPHRNLITKPSRSHQIPNIRSADQIAASTSSAPLPMQANSSAVETQFWVFAGTGYNCTIEWKRYRAASQSTIEAILCARHHVAPTSFESVSSMPMISRLRFGTVIVPLPTFPPPDSLISYSSTPSAIARHEVAPTPPPPRHAYVISTLSSYCHAFDATCCVRCFEIQVATACPAEVPDGVSNNFRADHERALCIMVTCLCRATIAAGKLNDLDEVALIVADSVYRLIRHRVRVINHY
jgi:hypothetical protein